MVFLALQKLFSFMMSNLLIGKLSSCTSSVLYRNLSLVPSHWSHYSPIFFPIRFSVFGFKLRSLINLDLSFVHGNRYGSNCNFLHLPALFFEVAFYFPVWISCVFIKKESGIHMCVDLCLSLCVYFKPISWNSLPDIMLKGSLSCGLTWVPPLGDQESCWSKAENTIEVKGNGGHQENMAHWTK